MSAPLIMDESIRKNIAASVEYGDTHLYTIEDVREMHRTKFNTIGDNPQHTVHIPVAWTCTYSNQVSPTGWRVRHLSISDDLTHKLPNPVLIEELLKEYGFRHGLSSKNYVQIEEKTNVVHVIENIARYEPA